MYKKQYILIETTLVDIDNEDGSFEISKHLADKLKKGDQFYIESLSYLRDQLGYAVDGLHNLEEFTIEIDYKCYMYNFYPDPEEDCFDIICSIHAHTI